MARPRLLFLASVAATLVSFVAAGGGESMGEEDCGKAQTWKLAAGEEKRCCTSWLMNDVDRFEYQATPVVSGSWGPGSITFSVEEYSIWEDIANPEKVSAAKCQLDGSAQTCTGDACVSPGSPECDAVVDISAKGHEDICVVAKCDYGAKCEDHQVEIRFHHSDDYDDDDGDNDSYDSYDWYGDGWYDAGGEDFDDVEGLLQCFAACPSMKSEFYEGECGALSDKNEDRWCSIDGRDYCCAASEDDCCVVNEGAIAGIAIACIVAISGCVIACCYFGKCCCFQYRRNTPAQVVYVQGAPAMQMTQMAYPQGTYPGPPQAPVAAAPSGGNPNPSAAIYTATIDPPGASAPVYPTAQAQPQIQYADGSRYTPKA